MSSSNSSLDEGDVSIVDKEDIVPTANPAAWTKEVIYSHADQAEADRLGKKMRILHFNDAYNIESSDSEPKAGAARFHTALNELKSDDVPTIVLFSGDAFSPSSRKFFFII
jgi:hypothetical protein